MTTRAHIALAALILAPQVQDTATPTARVSPACGVCNDPTGVRCCEFGRDA